MAFKNIREFIALLRKHNELVEVSEAVSTEYEMTEIVDRYCKAENGGKAVLFTNTGTDFPVLMNAMGSIKRICMALNVEDLDDISDRIYGLFDQMTTPRASFLDKLKLLPLLKEVGAWMPNHKSGKGECQEVIVNNPDLSMLPVLKTWPYDGGKFITFPLVHTTDADSGMKNMGMYRMQIMGKDTTGLHWHQHKTGARHYDSYKAKGERMPVTVVLGGDPAYTYAATAPMPENMDEYLLAGFLRKKKVELVKCITNDIEVPADADFVLEGYVDTSEPKVIEGPFGDHTGFYSLEDEYPVFHITCITHRKDAVYPATIVGVPPMEDTYIGKATERIFVAPMRLVMAPEMLDMNLPAAGVAHNLAIASIKDQFDGQGLKLMNTFWGAGQMMFNKVMMVTNSTVDVQDELAVAKEATRTVKPQRDISFANGPLDVLDHSSSKFAVGSKMGFDLTQEAEEIAWPNLGVTKEILSNMNNVHAFSTELLGMEVSALTIALEDGSRKGYEETVAAIQSNDELSKIKFIIFVDKGLAPANYYDVAWYVLGNIDPSRDVIISEGYKGQGQLFVDGSRKTISEDKFIRDWPNPVTMDMATIEQVDQRWDALGLGEFVPSPSRRYVAVANDKGAVYEKGHGTRPML